VDCIWKNEKICASTLAAADIQGENLGKFWGPELAEHWKLNNSHCMLGLYLHNIFSKLGIFFLDFIHWGTALAEWRGRRRGNWRRRRELLNALGFGVGLLVVAVGEKTHAARIAF